MRVFRDLYFLVFCFWFRLDLFTKSREDKALKALFAVTIVQAWAVLGSYRWGEMLLDLPSATPARAMAAVLALFISNYAILLRRGWEEFDRNFALLSPGSRAWWLIVAAGANLAALALLLSAAIVARSGR